MRLFDRLSIRQRLLSAFTTFTLLTVAAGAVGAYGAWQIGDAGVRLGEKLAPLGDAAMEIKLTATKAHLIFEEIMAGDAGEDIQAVWALLDETLFYANAILSGGRNGEGVFHATESEEVRTKILGVRDQISAFIESARLRYQQRTGLAGTGTEADQSFDALYEGVLERIDRLQADLQGRAADQALPAVAAAGAAKFRLSFSSARRTRPRRSFTARCRRRFRRFGGTG